MDINSTGRKPPSSLNRAITIILFLVVGILIIALLANRGLSKSKDMLANGTPKNLFTHYSNIVENKYEITTWEGQPTFDEFIKSSSIIIEAKLVSEEVQDVYGTEQRFYNMQIIDIIHSSNNSIKTGDIIKVQGEMHDDENFSYKAVDSTILSLDKLIANNYVPKNDMMGVFYSLNEKIYPACDIHDFADYIGIKKSKFISKVEKLTIK